MNSYLKIAVKYIPMDSNLEWTISISVLVIFLLLLFQWPAEQSIQTILRAVQSIPEKYKTAIVNNGGG